MSAFKSHKRKLSIKSEPGSPDVKNVKSEPGSPHAKNIKSEPGSPNAKNIKVETVFQTPNKTSKQQNKKTPKSVNRQKSTPGGKFKKETPTPQTPKLEEKSEGNNKINRHKKRRVLGKEKRREQRQRFSELKGKAIQGDVAAIEQVKLKIAALESGETLSKNKKRKLAMLKRILNKDGSQKKETAVQPNKIGKPKPPSAPQINRIATAGKQAPKQHNKNVPKVQQNGKVTQAKKPAVTLDEEDDDEDEQESNDDDASEDEDDEGSADEEGIGSFEEIDQAEGSDEEEEGSEDEDEDDDEDEDAEVNKVVSNRNTLEQKNKQSKQQNKPGKQEVSSKSSPGISTASPGNKSSRYVVFVGNIAYSSTENDLREHFKKVGEIADIRIPSNQDGKPRGFAYVELKDEAAYQKALSLHNTFLGGRKINVLYTQGGKKKSENQKNQIKSKNFKLQAMRKQGQLQGSVKENQKRAARRGKFNKQKST